MASGIAEPRRLGTTWRRIAAAAALLAGIGAAPAGAAEATRLKIVGGLAGVAQYRQYEEPFWAKRIGELSGGRIAASIVPFDRSGLRGQDMLQLMKLGVVPFGTALLAVVAGDEPQLNALDLSVVSPTMEDLRASARALRPSVGRLLAERYDIELLGVYAHPAQVLYCAKPFSGLADIAGRRVRTSSVGQSEFVTGLGGVPVQIAFAETVGAVTSGVVDCAITGTLPGFEIGLSEVTSHIHGMALSWGVSIFGANRTAWEALAPDLREIVRSGVRDLEGEIWRAAEAETARGFACNTGAAECGGRRGRLVQVPPSPADDARRRRLLIESVLPRWIDRCGDECITLWNEVLAPRLGFRLGAE